MIELQRVLVITNANDFKLRLRPTEEEFIDLTTDFAIWSLRVVNYLKGGLESQKVLHRAVMDIYCAAMARFRELSGQGTQ